jgi:hypothetical protein
MMRLNHLQWIFIIPHFFSQMLMVVLMKHNSYMKNFCYKCRLNIAKSIGRMHVLQVHAVVLTLSLIECDKGTTAVRIMHGAQKL